jgi:hypothetical protein
MNNKNIWNKVKLPSEINQNIEIIRKTIVIKEVQKEDELTKNHKNEEKIDLNNEDEKIEENSEETKKESNNSNKNSLSFKNKKRGRRATNNLENKGTHDKNSHDNIKRKVKTHFHNFIIALLNMKSKHLINKRYSFGKISSEITQNITVEYNQNLFGKKIKEIIVKVSDKYQDKNRNKLTLEVIMKRANENDEIMKFLNMTYKDMYTNYYLKSNKKTFEGNSEDESYESHIIKLGTKYGHKYASNFKKNAESLINFFYTCKKRIRKKEHKKLINPYPLLNISDISKNTPNLLYKQNNNTEDILGNFSNSKISASTQTNMILSEDEEDF